MLNVTKDSYLGICVKLDKINEDTSIGNLVVWPGDINVNGMQDGTINMYDVIQIAKSFGSVRGSDLFNQYCDLNGDDAINFADVVIVAKHFNASSGVITQAVRYDK